MTAGARLSLMVTRYYMDDSAALNEKYDRKADNGTRASVQMHTDTSTVDMTVVLYYSGCV